MREGLRSRGLVSKPANGVVMKKDDGHSRLKKGDRIAREGDNAKEGTDFVSSEQNCVKESSDSLERGGVDVSANGNAVTATTKIGRLRPGNKRRRVKSSDQEKDKANSDLEKVDETNDTQESERQPQVLNLTSSECVEDSLASAVGGRMEEKRNESKESEHIECNEEAYISVHGDNHTVNPQIGKRRRGRKRRRMGSPDKEKDKVNSDVENGDETKNTQDSKRKPEDSKLIYPECAEDSLASAMERSMEGKINECKESEHMECNEEACIGAHVDNHTVKPQPQIGKRRRGRKRKMADGSVRNGDDGAWKKKVTEATFNGKTQIGSRILRSRTGVMSGSEKMVDGLVGGVLGDKGKMGSDDSINKMVEMENAGGAQLIGRRKKKIKRRRGRPRKVQGLSGKKESDASGKKIVEMEKAETAQSIGMRKKKMKGRRGRPPKVQGKIELLKMFGGEKQDSVSRENSDQLKFKRVVAGSKHSRLDSYSHHEDQQVVVKQLKRNNPKVGERKRSTEKQLLRDRIMAMLKSAGWTMEYRPRSGKEYNDAVYVSPQGRTFWSVTLAYTILKQQVEAGDADSRSISAFTPIPEEEFSKLFRITKKKMGLKTGLKGEIESANKANKGVTKKKLAKKKIGGFRNGRTKHKPLDSEQDDSANTKRGVQRSNREDRKNRKRYALLVRGSKKGLDPDILDDRKRNLLSWMIELGTVPLNGKVQYKNNSSTQVLLEGRMTRDGICCDCCKSNLALSDFESHAGSTLSQPLQNIYLESGASLLQCLLDLWSKHEASECIEFRSVDTDGDDPNDDTCNKCGDGGDLICCDSCPSTFHQNCLNIEKFPSGDWNCVYCSCKFCGMVGGNASQSSQNCDIPGSALLMCCLCEEKFHPLCAQVKDANHVDSNCSSFCGKECEKVFERLQTIVGVKQQLQNGFSWTLIQRVDVSQDISLSSVPQKVECNSKLPIAFSVLEECFLPIVDQRSGINMLRNVVYSCGSNFSRLNYAGFFTAILERGDEIISVASIRIHGNRLAEMPFIGTRHIYRRQGMCRRLLDAIESALCSLDVEKIVIPAISELVDTWTTIFGFVPLEESNKKDLKHMNIIVFPGVSMLEKPLLKQKFAEENLISTAGHVPGTNAAESILQPPDVSLNDTLKRETINFQESVAIENCLVDSVVTPDNQECKEKDIQYSEASGRDVHGVDGQHTLEEINKQENVHSAAAAESVLQLCDVSLNDASDLISETVNFQESVTIENCLVDSGVAHDNQECKEKDIQDSEGSGKDVHGLHGQHTLEEIDKQENGHSAAAAEPVLQLRDMSLNDASDLISETVNFQESVTIENCLVDSGVAHDNQECKEKDIQDSEGSGRDVHGLHGQHTLEEIDKQENGHSAAAAEPVLQLRDMSLNDASDLISETVNFQESVSIENCLVDSGVAHDNQECKEKDIQDSEGSGRDVHGLHGQHTLEEIDKQENGHSAAAAEPVLQLRDMSLNDASDLISETVNFQESITIENCLVDSDVAHDNQECKEKDIQDSEGSGRDVHGLHGQHTLEEIDKQENGHSAAAAEPVLQLRDMSLNDASDLISETVNFQETVTIENCLVDSGVSRVTHANQECEEKDKQDSEGSGRDVHELDGRHTMEDISKQENGHSGSTSVPLNGDSKLKVTEHKLSYSSQMVSESTNSEGKTFLASDGKGQEDADCKHSGEVNAVNDISYTLSVGSVPLS